MDSDGYAGNVREYGKRWPQSKGSSGPTEGTAEEIAGGQGAIHFSIVADPTNANIVYVGGDRQPRTNNDTGGFPNSIGANDFTGRLFRGDASQPTGSQWVHLTHAVRANGGGTASTMLHMLILAKWSLMPTETSSSLMMVASTGEPVRARTRVTGSA